MPTRKIVNLWPLPCLLILALSIGTGVAWGETCEKVVQQLNRKLSPKIDERELVMVLRSLNETKGRELPQKFLTKKQARRMGWRPGKDLWAVPSLRGKSIGGDPFSNRERKLSGGDVWHEADLDYKGGHRGAKRIIFSTEGSRMVTVDHYKTFSEVPACR